MVGTGSYETTRYRQVKAWKVQLWLHHAWPPLGGSYESRKPFDAFERRRSPWPILVLNLDGQVQRCKLLQSETRLLTTICSALVLELPHTSPSICAAPAWSFISTTRLQTWDICARHSPRVAAPRHA